MKPEHPALFTERFQNRIRFLEKSSTFSAKEISQYQNRLFIRLYRLAYSKSPYYHKLFKEAGLEISSIKDISTDLRRIPISTKDDLKKAGKNILTTLKFNQLTTRTTGGSTGNPLIVYGNPAYYSKDKANTYYYVSYYKHNIFTSRSVRLYGTKVQDSNGKQLLFQYNNKRLKLELNCFMMNTNNIQEVYNEIVRHRPEYIHARARAILSLARTLEYNNLDGSHFGITHVFVDGENISENDQYFLETFFSAKLVNVYGHTEGSLFAFPCTKTSDFHYQYITGILEVIDDPAKYGLPDSYANTALVTGLNNFAMPFIRYATGDIVSNLRAHCQACNHQYFVSSPIVGRSSDYVVTKDLSTVALSSIMYNYDDVDWSLVKYWQASQDDPGILNVSITPVDGLLSTQQEKLLLNIQSSLVSLCSPYIDVHVNIMHLEPNARGKVSNFLQNIII